MPPVAVWGYTGEGQKLDPPTHRPTAFFILAYIQPHSKFLYWTNRKSQWVGRSVDFPVLGYSPQPRPAWEWGLPAQPLKGP